MFDTTLGVAGRNKIHESADPDFPDLLAVWGYVYYEDVFGTFYRSGGRFVAAKPVSPGKPGVWSYYADPADPVFEENPEQTRQR